MVVMQVQTGRELTCGAFQAQLTGCICVAGVGRAVVIRGSRQAPGCLLGLRIGFLQGPKPHQAI